MFLSRGDRDIGVAFQTHPWDMEWGTFPWGKASAMPLVMACPLSLQNDDYCTLGIEATYLSSSSREPLWILGDVFLKEFYCL